MALANLDGKSVLNRKVFMQLVGDPSAPNTLHDTPGTFVRSAEKRGYSQSSYDVVRHAWLKIRTRLPTPSPPPPVALIPSVCSKCSQHIRRCKCSICQLCLKIEDECACAVCKICQLKECACIACSECNEQYCTQAGKLCQCHCLGCKALYRVHTKDLTDPVCHCSTTAQQAMGTRLALLKTLEETRSNARQKKIRALTEKMSGDWLAENVPDYFCGERTIALAQRTLGSVAGVYELHWNDMRETLRERPKLIIQIHGAIVWGCCSWDGKLTSMFKIGQVPAHASTAQVDCHLAFPKTAEEANEWDFGEPGQVQESADGIATANLGGIRFLADNLCLVDRSVVGVTAAIAYPAVIFGVRVTDDTHSKSLKQLWDLKHERCCGCGGTDGHEAAGLHRQSEVRDQKEPKWDEEFVDQSVMRLREDPLQDFRSVDRLFLSARAV